MDVVIVGGGISGLTAAYQLLKRKIPVTVLEAEPNAGGQARAFDVDGVTVEHGSHAFFGYYQTITGIIEELRREEPNMPTLAGVPGWTLVDPYGRRALLQHSRWLPRVLSVAPSILRVPWYSWGDKLRTLWAALRLVLTPFRRYRELDQHTSYDYARSIGYSEIGALTWNSASLGLTNLFVQEQSAAIFAGKHKLLIGTPAGLTYQLPAGNLSDLIANPLRRRVEALGGVVRTGASVREIGRPAGAPRTRVRFVVDGKPEEREADHVIVAVQPQAARALVPWALTDGVRWGELQPVTPVITVVLRLSGRLAQSIDDRELGMSREQWTFSVVTDLSRFWPEFTGDKTVLRCEVGHADRLPRGIDTPDDELMVMIKRDLDRLYPEAAALTVEWAKMHRETKQLYVAWKRGEFSKKVSQRDVGQGVFLAGDWTSKGTIGMEAAANSGVEAANHVLAAAGMELVAYRDVPLE